MSPLLAPSRRQLESFLDRELIAGLRLEPAREEQAWRDLEAFAATLRGADGALHLNIAPQIFTAVTADV